MSKQFKNCILQLRDVEHCVLRAGFVYGDIKLTTSQSEVLADIYIMWLNLVFDLFLDRSAEQEDISRLLNWVLLLNSLDVKLLVQSLESTKEFLINIDDSTSLADYCRFKHDKPDSFYPLIFQWIETSMRSILEERNTVEFTRVNQFLNFPLRANLEIDYTEELIEKWKTCESQLADLDLEIGPVRVMNRIMREWFQEFSFIEYLPRHGNGAVSSISEDTNAFTDVTHFKNSIVDKYLQLHSDVRLQYFYRQLGLDSMLDAIPMDNRLLRVSELVIVPKSLKTGRPICKEPATLQYCQQGIWRSLDMFLSRHHTLSRHIHIHDQDQNKNMARIGSLDRSYATIDLSSASDTVSWDLVKRLFKGTVLLRGLSATKSDYCYLPNKEIVKLRKFAPMGSAVCFPIETIIFSCVCEYCVRYSGINFKHLAYSVYGDDIVVDTRISEEVIQLLTQIGFSINAGKTFCSTTKGYRESCGGEYFNGDDVSVIRVSRKFTSSLIQSHPNLYSQFVEAANAAYHHRYVFLRSKLLQPLLSLPQNVRPMFSNIDGSLRSDYYSNFHLKSFYVKRYQNDYVACGVVTSKTNDPLIRSGLLEEIRLFETLRVTSTRTRPTIWPDDTQVIQVSRPSQALKTRKCMRPEY